MMGHIEIDNVSMTYRSRTGEDITALKDVSLSVNNQEFITLVGPSGCGKSTLLKLIAYLIEPTGGSLYLAGKLHTQPDPNIGVVFQDPSLLPWRTVLDNVLLPVEILGHRRADFKTRAIDLLGLVGLSGFEKRMPNELSGGMQQRANICRALIHDPEILLMDEPFAALDAMTREDLGLELMRIWDRNKKSIIFVTHSIPEAILLADRVVVMTPRPGKISKVIDVKLDRPRTLEMEFDPLFKTYSDEIRGLIKRH